MLTLDQVRPFGDRILVRPDAKHTLTESGLHIPEVVQADNPNYYNMHGIVVRLGDGVRDEDGVLGPYSVKVGDRVVFNRYAGKQIEIEDPVDLGDQARDAINADGRNKIVSVEAFGQTVIQEAARAMREAPKTYRYLMMHEHEALLVVDGEHRIAPVYEAPKWNKPSEGLTPLGLPPTR